MSAEQNSLIDAARTLIAHWDSMRAFERNLSGLDMTLADLASFVTLGAPSKPIDEQIDRDARECVEGRARAVGGVELARVA